MDPGLKQHTIKLFVSFSLDLTNHSASKAEDPRSCFLFAVAKKKNHLLSVLYLVCWPGRLRN